MAMFSKTTWHLVAIGLALPVAAHAQAPVSAPSQPVPAPSQRQTSGPSPFYDPAQLPSFTGHIQQFTLTPRGDIDGVILSDGTEVKTPPHLSTSMAYSIKPGDTVIIHGLHAAAMPLIQAVSITDRTSGRTVVDSDAGPAGPPGPPGAGPMPAVNGPGPGAAGLVEAQGRVRMDLHGPRGEVNGALLSDGTVLRLPPDAAFNLASLIAPGQTLVAEGIETSSALGRVLDVREIGASRGQLNSVAALPPPGPGPRRRPPPPPQR